MELYFVRAVFIYIYFCFPVLGLDDDARLFREERVSNYSSMLLREDVGLLLVGARDVIYALDMQDVSRKKSEVKRPRAPLPADPKLHPLPHQGNTNEQLSPPTLPVTCTPVMSCV